MNRSRQIAVLFLTGLLSTSVALAQSGSTSGQVGGTATAQTATRNLQGSATADVATQASATADLERAKNRLETQAAKVSTGARAKADAQLEAVAKSVDDNAEKGGEVVAGHLAAEFGTTAQAIEGEQGQLNASWGNLMIAHTLSMNAKTDVTVAQLVEMHQDGMGWGQIAAGIGFELGSVMRGVKAEGRVALGQAKADGHAAMIHGEGAKAGLSLGANSQVGTQPGKLGVGAGVGATTGIKLGH